MRKFTKNQVDQWFAKPVNFNRKEFFFLKDILNQYTVKSMVEIGVWKGGLTWFILQNCPDIYKYWAVDAWSYQPSLDSQMDDYYRQLDQSQWNQTALDVYRLMLQHPGRLSVIRLPSADAINLFANQSLDCVFIDGDHSYQGAMTDFEKWIPKVKPKKLICGDDLHRTSVKKAIRNASQSLGLKFITSSGLYWVATV